MTCAFKGDCFQILNGLARLADTAIIGVSCRSILRVRKLRSCYCCSPRWLAGSVPGFSFFCGLFLLLLGCVLNQAQAQISYISPDADELVALCDDFATNELHDPWDMSNSEDINNHVPGDVSGFSGVSWAGGVFSFTTTVQNGVVFYLFSPRLGGTYRSGARFGQDLPLDTSKYRVLHVRMYTDSVDSGGMKLIWNRGDDYVAARSVSQFIPIETGWHTYTVDLNSLPLSAAESSDLRPWSAGSITGFAIQPTQQANAHVAIDWIRLEDPASCGTYDVTYRLGTGAAGGYLNIYLDDDSDPLNGYLLKGATARTISDPPSLRLSLEGLGPGTSHVVGLFDADWATLMRDNPWDFDDSSDVLVTDGISSISYANGVMSGIATRTDPSIYLSIPGSGIDSSRFSKLSLGLAKSTGPTSVFWQGGQGLAGHVFTNDPPNGVFELDLSQFNSWTGAITNLIVRPAGYPGASFHLDFVALRSDGFVASLKPDSLAVSTGELVLNHPPRLEFIEPDVKGGVALRPWNMNLGDFVLFQNLRDDSDPGHPGEPYSAWLPDVRIVEGRRGDFFKGTNVLGNEDPNNFSIYPYSTNPITFAAADYPNLCFELLVERDFDLCLGSVARIIWQDSTLVNYISDDLVLSYNRWGTSRWEEYCAYMPSIRHDNGAIGWQGSIASLRVDPHEFSRDTCAGGVPSGDYTSTSYYFDWLKLRRFDATSSGTFSIVYRLSDPEQNPALALYYSTRPLATGGSLIANDLSANDGVYFWDTPGLPSGVYYVYGVASDGVASTTRLAGGPILVQNPAGDAGNPPVLVLETPVSGITACDTLQVKGYALEPDRFEEVAVLMVYIDGTLAELLKPNVYSPAAKTSYPEVDSSNSGFNALIDFSAYALGPHIVSIRAVSTDGQVVSSGDLTVLRGVSNCPAVVTDPDPAGSPISADVPRVPQASAPLIKKPKYDSKGRLTFKLSQANENGSACTIVLKAGLSKQSTDSAFAVINAQKSSLSLSTKKALKVNRKKLKKFYMLAEKSCEGYAPAMSSARKVNPGASGKIASLSALLRKLSKLKIK